MRTSERTSASTRILDIQSVQIFKSLRQVSLCHIYKYKLILLANEKRREKTHMQTWFILCVWIYTQYAHNWFTIATDSKMNLNVWNPWIFPIRNVFRVFLSNENKKRTHWMTFIYSRLNRFSQSSRLIRYVAKKQKNEWARKIRGRILSISFVCLFSMILKCNAWTFSIYVFDWVLPFSPSPTSSSSI